MGRKRKAKVEGELSYSPEFFGEVAQKVLKGVPGVRVRAFDQGQGLIARLVKGIRPGGVFVRDTGEPIVFDIEVSADPAGNLYNLGLEVQEKLRGLVKQMTGRNAVVNVRISGSS